MRIAFISGMTGAPWGGSEVLWSEAAKRLIQQGHAVFASVTRWPNAPAQVDLLRSMGVVVSERSSNVQYAHKILTKVMPGIPVSKIWNPYWQSVLNFRPDIVCISHGSALCGIDWMVYCHQSGIPYVSIAQANSENWWPDDANLDRITRAYKGAKRAYFVSAANLELFERQIGTKLDNGEVVFNPFNVRWDADPSWPDEDGHIRLACVARLEPSAKGQDLLFQVLSTPKWMDRSIKVSLIGSGPCENSLKRMASTAGISDKVTFVGQVGDIENVWRSHHALILPSRFEGLPLSLVEAMICARPVIVTDVAGNGTFVEDNETGFLAEAATPHHLDEAMERAWMNSNNWKAMGIKAANSIRKRIPHDPAGDMAGKLLNVLLQ